MEGWCGFNLFVDDDSNTEEIIDISKQWFGYEACRRKGRW